MIPSTMYLVPPAIPPISVGGKNAVAQRLEMVANDDLGDADDAVQELGTGAGHKHVVFVRGRRHKVGDACVFFRGVFLGVITYDM